MVNYVQETNPKLREGTGSTSKHCVCQQEKTKFVLSPI